MASSYRSAITKFAKRHGPIGDTKYDIFDRGGPHGEPRLGERRLRRGRTKRVPSTPRVVAKIHPKRIV